MSGFDQHCIIELMGHGRISGKASEQTIAGAVFLRVDVPKTSTQEGFSKWFSATSVYSITPVDEAIALAAAESFCTPPVAPWVFRVPESPALAARITMQTTQDEEIQVAFDDFDDDPPPDAVKPDPLQAKHLKAKAEAASAASAIWRNQPVYLDFETTSPNPAEARIIQIGLIDHEGNTLLNTLVHPGFQDNGEPIGIPAEATGIHGITDAMVAGQPGFGDIWPTLKALLDDKMIVCYNKSYERSVLSNHWIRAGVRPFPPYNFQCAMLLYADFAGDWNHEKQSYRWHKLSEACQRENITVENAHDALADVQMTRLLVKTMADYDEIPF